MTPCCGRASHARRLRARTRAGEGCELGSPAAAPRAQELVRRWENHKLMIRFLSHVFKYLDRFYVKRLSLPELAEVGSQSFHEIIFNAVKREVRTAILELIRREREGEIVDRKLVKEVVEARAAERSEQAA